ncbi:YihY/virulence factor BrkB family protein [uncultured Nocardioides sp.]|uniref:YihY/virulence factor BrkB family protein n=1 Tax=uncultured Nocardioides sp. TaxID=198441 RepID=UPI0025FE0C16|nr:YihY/virulence factor BrkB family protein [uncultured Nocardioides sp.]
MAAAEDPDHRAVADDAVSPGQIPVRGWRQILPRALRHVVTTRLPLLSAGIAFFAVLSIAPVLVTALSVYGAVNTPAQARDQLTQVAQLLPAPVEPLVADQLRSITTASTKVLTLRGVVGLLIALGTATTAMASLIDALTVAYHEPETRGLLRRSALAVAFALGGALLVGAVIAAVGVTSRALGEAPAMARAVAPVLIWLALAALMSAMLAVLYRFAPDRQHARWRWITWGATGATALWVATSVALFAYVQRLGTYEATYGSLAGVAISMFWLWISVLLVLVGAAVNGEAERQTARDSTVGAERPLGERGAVVADSAPPYPQEP